MNDDYDNSKTDREMLNRLVSDGDAAALPGDDVVAFTFPMTAPAAGELTSLAQSAADLLQTRGHRGPFRVTVTVACLDGCPHCEPQLWDDGGPR